MRYKLINNESSWIEYQFLRIVLMYVHTDFVHRQMTAFYVIIRIFITLHYERVITVHNNTRFILLLYFHLDIHSLYSLVLEEYSFFCNRF